MKNKIISAVSSKQKEIYIFLIITGIIIKALMLSVKVGDYVCFLEPWMNFIKSHDYFSSLKHSFYNYTPSYIYFLIGITKFGLNPLYSVKLFSIFFEYVLAYFIGKSIAERYNTKITIWASIAIIPLLPSVVLNSSYLSQCDSVYSAFVIGSIYFILKKKPFFSVLFLGIGFMFKMQSVFLLPFFFVMLLRGNVKWYYFILIPFIYFISILPAWYYGRSLNDLIGIYLHQANSTGDLTLNFPNLYIWINNDFYEPIKTIGVVFTALFTLATGLWLSQKRFVFTYELWVKLAFLSAIVVPFLLPGMHERYMYLGDVLGVLYFLVVRKNIHLPIGIALVSFYSYVRCSRYNDILPMEPAFFIYLAVIILTTIDFVSSLKHSSNEIPN